MSSRNLLWEGPARGTAWQEGTTIRVTADDGTYVRFGIRVSGARYHITWEACAVADGTFHAHGRDDKAAEWQLEATTSSGRLTEEDMACLMEACHLHSAPAHAN